MTLLMMQFSYWPLILKADKILYEQKHYYSTSEFRLIPYTKKPLVLESFRTKNSLAHESFLRTQESLNAKLSVLEIPDKLCYAQFSGMTDWGMHWFLKNQIVLESFLALHHSIPRVIPAHAGILDSKT